MSTIPTLADLKRRRNDLEMKKARYGISAPPEYMIEAEDLANVIGMMERIDIKRANLAHYLKQRDQLGNHTPAHILSSIMQERADIIQLRQACANKGHFVPDHSLDTDEPGVTTTAPVSRPPTDIRAKLDQIEHLLREIRAAL